MRALPQRGLTLSLICALALIVGAGCSNPSNPGTAAANAPPQTALANIPTQDSTGAHPTANPTVTLYWIGNDPDGFIVAFSYRWSYRQNGVTIYRDWQSVLNTTLQGIVLQVSGSTDAIPSIYKYFLALTPTDADSAAAQLDRGQPLVLFGDSVTEADPVRLPNPHKGVFIFESKDTLNPHTFEVRAVDNLGAVDPHPAHVTFWTPEAQPPDTRIIEPFPPDSSYLIGRITDTFAGLTFYFEGIDPDSKTLEYSWSVDSVRWSPYSLEPSATITSADLAPPLTGTHTLYVKTRNDYDLEDPSPASYRFTVIVPAFANPNAPEHILLLNATRSGTGVLGNPTSAQLNTYYTHLLDSAGKAGTYDLWTVKTQGFPRRTTLANYTSIVMFDDNYLGDLSVRLTSDRAQLLSEYLTVGGKLIMSGWQWPLAFDNPDSFFLERIHAEATSILQPQYYGVDNAKDYVGAKGQLNYPDVSLDPSKLPAAWDSTLQRMAYIYPRGFAEIIYRFDSKSDSTLFENRPLGLRYLGITYSVVYFGFPLYFADQPQAVATLRKALEDIQQ